MKAKMIVALIVAICMLSPVADAQRIKVEELRKDNGIESVYLSKSMLKMASKYLKRKTDISINTSLLDGMYIFSTDMNRSSSAALIRRTFSPIMGGSRKDYEELMSVQDGNERIGFYAEKGKKNTFRTLVLYTEDAEEIRALVMEGTFTREQLNQMIYPNGRSRYFRKEWNVLKPDNSEAMRKYRKQKEKYYQEYMKAQKKQNQEWRKEREKLRREMEKARNQYREEMKKAREELRKSGAESYLIFPDSTWKIDMADLD